MLAATAGALLLLVAAYELPDAVMWLVLGAGAALLVAAVTFSTIAGTLLCCVVLASLGFGSYGPTGQPAGDLRLLLATALLAVFLATLHVGDGGILEPAVLASIASGVGLAALALVIVAGVSGAAAGVLALGLAAAAVAYLLAVPTRKPKPEATDD